MKRWHEERHIAFRNWSERLSLWWGDLANAPEMGRYRKKDAYDCGRARCGLCSRYKIPKREKTNKELASQFSFEEQVRELTED